jgi:Zn finger protein HypA/HybF involved in hydrogenase expression
LKKLTKEIIIKRFNNIHNYKFNYSKIQYKNTNTKIEIICSKHGSFYQKPLNHLRGQGCPKCAGKNLDNLEWIDKFNKIHNRKYSYPDFNFTNTRDKITIICPEHGKFFQSIIGHSTNKQGCPKCYINRNRTDDNISDMINNFKLIHKNKYNYENMVFYRKDIKIKIKCNNCNSFFFQRPSCHLQGSGCPECYNNFNISKGEEKIEQFLKNENIPYKREYKFKNCKHKNKLPFDFYLPELNTIIEFDGAHHFKSIPYFGGIKRLKQTQINDNIKNNYCKNNNIKLIRISYKDFKKIEEILKEKIK